LSSGGTVTSIPGLTRHSYIASNILLKAILNLPCKTFGLRYTNLIATLLTLYSADLCKRQLELLWGCQRRAARAGQTQSVYSFHTAINVTLFPVLFFFSALYYTDILSTLATLGCYSSHLDRLAGGRSLKTDIRTFLLGVVAIAMRQTNVFWIVVYMGGSEAVNAIKKLRHKRHEVPRFTTVTSMLNYYFERYRAGEIHDPQFSLSHLRGQYILSRSRDVQRLTQHM
jgi:alpha-1,2-glucosyltransferase